VADPRNVIITGAGGGMGSNAVRQVVMRGDVNVIGVDVNAKGLSALLDSLSGDERERLHVIEADVSDPAAVEAFVAEAIKRWNGLDGLFNAAGIAKGETLLEMPVESFDRTMNVNARSVWLTMKFVVPAMLKRGSGRIVNTGSHLAIRGGAAFSHYAASKHAVVGMTKSVALEHAADGIVANVVCPGGMDTQMIWEAFKVANPENPERARDEMVAALPQKRLARPDELAATGVWLLLDSPWHLSGQVINVDGAYQAG
jgi:NAD(P)-dependent dehydrogenase (short-subunit alcohol dehydrogenase family)